MTRKVLILISAIALTCVGVGAIAPGDEAAGSRPAPANWLDRAWKYRLKVFVEVNNPDQSDSSDWRALEHTAQLTASAEVHVKNPASDASQNIRVVDARGKTVPCRAYFLNKPETLTVLFSAPREGGDFWIYFGNDSPRPRERDNWLPATKSLTFTTLRIASTIFPRSLKQVKAVLRGGTSLQGRKLVNQIAGHVNPVGLRSGNNRYVTCVEGYLNCEIPGEYKFAVDSGGPGFLLINGELIATNNGTHRPSAKWTDPHTVILEKGYHHFRLLLAEMHNFQGVRLGWQPPGKKKVDVIPSQAYAKYVKAMPQEFARADGAESIYFAFNESTVGMKLPTKTVAPVELINLSSFDDSKGRVDYVWKINGERKSTSERTTEGLEIGKSHKIRLEAYRSGKRIGKLERICRPYAHSLAYPEFKLETIGAPNIVFVGEQENLSFRILSSMARAMSFDWEYVLTKPGGGGRLSRRRGRLDVTGSEEAALSIPLDTCPYGRDSEITVTLSASGDVLASSMFHVMPLGRKVRKLRSRIGCLVDDKGHPVIISTHLIDQATFRKWLVPRYFKSVMTSSNKNVFLYGCPMENTPSGGEEFTNYVSLLEDRWPEGTRTFDFVERSESINGILADVPKFATAISKRDPGTVVISPGLSDVIRGVPVRDFKRSIQVMLDLIRAKDASIKMVLVSPPPLATNVNLSQLYRDAMAKVAERNRAVFVDIHYRLNGTDYLKYYKSELDDSVYYTYPNDDGQKAITDAIWRHID